ncbi:polysaccharide deacetylase family protein [Candidatus Thioglobus sp.]|nr:polysaccharide deacetylase family protein [Candidatus Thioglobus sp.]
MLISICFSSISYALETDCVVLVYHRFSDEGPKSTSTSPEVFKEHLSYLQENEFTVLPLKIVVKKLQSKEKLPKNCVSLTADDGFLSIYKEAFPLLTEYQFPMSIFVSTNAIDKNYESMMTWSQLREMAPLVDVFNHTVNHSHLVNLLQENLENEIYFAQDRISKELGVKDKYLAYPYGEYDDETYSFLGLNGYIGFGQQSGVASQDSDFLNIPRFSMSGQYAKMESFILKVNTVDMPLKNIKPKSMIISGDFKPKLDLVFLRPLTKYERDNFACYVSGQNKAKLEWSGLQSVGISVEEPLRVGRSRYNCTMPFKENGRYYWFSKLWLRL